MDIWEKGNILKNRYQWENTTGNERIKLIYDNYSLSLSLSLSLIKLTPYGKR